MVTMFEVTVLVLISLSWGQAATAATVSNDRPVIGIFMQRSSTGTHGDTFLSADYVKFIEQAGARVVPIRIREPDQYYQELFKQINGVVYPGGHTGIRTSDYAAAGKIIYNLAEKANDAGDVFTLLGICEGFQMLTYLSTGHNLLHHAEATNVSLTLILDKDYHSSRLMKNMPTDLIQALSTENITPNFHHYGVSYQSYQHSKSLRDFYRVISTSKDNTGNPFLSTIEAYKYPFYAVQWHPEKMNFAWNPSSNLDHSSTSVRVSQYLADFFVDEARRSQHMFTSRKTLGQSLIENFPMHYWTLSFQQNYYINFTSPSRPLLG